MAKKERTKPKRLSAVIISGLAVFFVFSLSLHNHALYFGTFSENISQSKPIYPNHSSEFCSACRLNGDIKPHDVVNIFDSKNSGILIGFLGFDVLTPSLLLTSNKSPRSPPTT